MKKYIYFLMLSVFVLLSCNETDEINLMNSQNIEEQLSNKAPLKAILVAPSGDVTGVSDADNIEDALNTAKLTGGTVYLTDGYTHTTDDYYTSRNIVVDGFNGTLMGEGKNKTIINAGRKSISEGFAPAYSPIWTILKPGYPLASTVLQLDNSTGDVSIKNLSILIKDDQPTDIIPDAYAGVATYLWGMIELIGGEFNAIIENVNLEGKESSAFGNSYGQNTGWGIHIMPWKNPPSVEWPFQPTKGNLTIKNVDIENIGNDAILLMDYKDGSEINIEDVNVHDVGYGIAVSRINDSFVNVSNVTTSNHGAGWAQGLWFANINSGLMVTKNKISNANWFAAAFFFNVHGATINKNKFIDVGSFGATIALSGGSTGNTVGQNDFSDSKLLGWNSPSLFDGLGAVWLRDDTENNTVLETKFPMNGSKTYCNMILDQGNNTIKNWQPCENLGYKIPSNLKRKENQSEIKFEHKSRLLLDF